jgi:hypothetical protein
MANDFIRLGNRLINLALAREIQLDDQGLATVVYGPSDTVELQGADEQVIRAWVMSHTDGLAPKTKPEDYIGIITSDDDDED